MQLKRLWDTEGKKIVFAEGPSGHMCQVWTDVSGDHLYIYDMAQWLSYNGTSPAGMEYDRSNWVELVDQEVGFYDTNEPTDLYAWDSGDKASYKFVDWNGTVLKSGVVEEGETPTAPADPTRPATAQYTYTFAGWNPTVGPISKKTTFTATYTATVNEYTITWVDGDGNTLDTDTVAYGDTPEYTGSTPTKTATAQYTYTWDEGWTPSVVAVTGDATYTATFTATVNQYTVTIQSNNTDYGTVDESSVTVDYGTAISASSNVLTIGENTITATAETGYQFSSWGTLPATVTEALTITATFESTSAVKINRTLTPSNMVAPSNNRMFVQVDGLVDVSQVSVTSSNNEWYVNNISAEQGDGYNVVVEIYPSNYGLSTITVTDSVTQTSDSINLSAVYFVYSSSSVYVNQTSGRGVKAITPTGEPCNIEAWSENTSIASISSIIQPSSGGNRGTIWVVGVSEGLSYIHIKPQGYPELETRVSCNVSQYVELTQISNLSSSTATVYGYSADVATFDITPSNASDVSQQLNFEFDSTLYPDIGSLYVSYVDNGTVHLAFSPMEQVTPGQSCLFKISPYEHPESYLEITVTIGTPTTELTLSQDSVTVATGATANVSFTYLPANSDLESVILPDGESFYSMSITGSGGTGTLSITGLSEITTTESIYTYQGSILDSINISVTAPL